MTFSNVPPERSIAARAVLTTLPTLSPQCSACLSPALLSHCVICFGTHVPAGFTPQTYPSGQNPNITRSQLCDVAKQIPEADCVVKGFCDPDAEPSASSSSSSSTGAANGTTATNSSTAVTEAESALQVVEEIIGELAGVVGSVDVQPGNGGPMSGSPTTSSTTMMTMTTMSSVGVRSVSVSQAASTSSTTGGGGGGRLNDGAVGLCGSYHCT
ncbi:MAG: hypothetical protein Q9220_002468 [cf. Caloplaca sp. 1 TL-2023]